MSTSRYDSAHPLQLTTADGRKIAYLPRRLLPQPGSFALLHWRTTEEDASRVNPNEDADGSAGAFGPAPKSPGTRLDIIAWEEFQDPEMYWLLCDANTAMRPDGLEVIHTRLRIPLPAGVPAAPTDP